MFYKRIARIMHKVEHFLGTHSIIHNDEDYEEYKSYI